METPIRRRRRLDQTSPRTAETGIDFRGLRPCRACGVARSRRHALPAVLSQIPAQDQRSGHYALYANFTMGQLNNPTGQRHPQPLSMRWPLAFTTGPSLPGGRDLEPPPGGRLTAHGAYWSGNSYGAYCPPRGLGMREMARRLTTCPYPGSAPLENWIHQSHAATTRTRTGQLGNSRPGLTSPAYRPQRKR